MRSITFFLLLNLLFCFSAAAQLKQCRAKLRANRHVAISFKGLQLASYKWRYRYENTEIEYFAGTDSAVVRKENSFVSLKMKRLNNATTFIEYDSNGRLHAIDSSRSTHRGHTKVFYYTFSSAYISLSKTFYTNGQTESALYYNSNGYDSILKEWHSNGVPRRVKTYGLYTRDSLSSSWYDTGILSAVKNNTMTCEYNANGVLTKKEMLLPYNWPENPFFNWPGYGFEKRASYYETGILRMLEFDTLVNRHFTKCTKEYYSSGIIKSVKYFQDDAPCHTWLMYNGQGILTATIKKPATKENLFVGPGPSEPAAPQVFTIVEQMPEFPGGYKQFEEQLTEQFSALICKSHDPLKGLYAITFNISETGITSFIAVEGFNANALYAGFKNIVDTMPQWRPGKRLGMPQSTTYIMNLEVKPGR